MRDQKGRNHTLESAAILAPDQALRTQKRRTPESLRSAHNLMRKTILQYRGKREREVGGQGRDCREGLRKEWGRDSWAGRESVFLADPERSEAIKLRWRMGSCLEPRKEGICRGGADASSWVTVLRSLFLPGIRGGVTVKATVEEGGTEIRSTVELMVIRGP